MGTGDPWGTHADKLGSFLLNVACWEDSEVRRGRRRIRLLNSPPHHDEGIQEKLGRKSAMRGSHLPHVSNLKLV